MNSDGTIVTVAGTVGPFFAVSGDGGLAKDALIGQPRGLAVLPDGSFYVGDEYNGYVRFVDADGIISTVAGTGSIGYDGEGLPAQSTRIGEVTELALLPDGRLLIGEDETYRIRVLDFDGALRTVVGNGTQLWGGDGRHFKDATFHIHGDIEFASDGSAYVADTGNYRIRHIDADGIVSTVAGTGEDGSSGDGQPALLAQTRPIALATSPSGELYFLDARLRKLTSDGTVEHIAGTGEQASGGNGGDARLARLNFPQDFNFAPDGRIFIADTENSRIRYIDSDGIIWGFAGYGSTLGDGGPALNSQVNRPGSVAVGPDGSVYISELSGERIRRVDPQGIIQTIAGGNGSGFSGDEGPAVDAQLSVPMGMLIEDDGGIHFCDAGNHRIRYIDPQGIIHTVAGTGDDTYNGTNRDALTVNLNRPLRIARDQRGWMYFNSQWDGQMRRIRPTSEVPVAFHSLRARRTGDAVLVHWQADVVEAHEFRILRRHSAAEGWMELARQQAEVTGEQSYLDSNAPRHAGLSYAVSVYDRQSGLELLTLGPIDVEGTGALRLRARLAPNPARTQTTVYLDSVRGLKATVEIYDARGRKVCGLGAVPNRAESAQLLWTGRDGQGHRVASGLYHVLVRDEAGRVLWRDKLTLVR